MHLQILALDRVAGGCIGGCARGSQDGSVTRLLFIHHFACLNACIRFLACKTQFRSLIPGGDANAESERAALRLPLGLATVGSSIDRRADASSHPSFPQSPPLRGGSGHSPSYPGGGGNLFRQLPHLDRAREVACRSFHLHPIACPAASHSKAGAARLWEHACDTPIA